MPPGYKCYQASNLEQRPSIIERFLDIKGYVESLFTVKDSYLRDGIPTFILEGKSANLKSNFLRFFTRIKHLGLIPLLRKENGYYVLRVVEKTARRPPSVTYNLLLFLATLGTVTLAGYLLSMDFHARFYDLSASWLNVIRDAFLFTAVLLSIIGVHELGHKLACKRNNVEATLPYFIPAPPIPPLLPIGTFGAVIMQKDPPANRDQLFDLGVSGPLAGFIMVLIFLPISLMLSKPAPPIPGTFSLPVPLIFYIFMDILPIQLEPGHVLYLHPVAFAVWVGVLVTFLNLMPVWQLDGGHIARATLGQKGQVIAAFLCILLLILLRLDFIAIFLLFLMLISGGRHPGSLEDISELSSSRKLFSIIVVVVLILSTPLPFFPF